MLNVADDGDADSGDYIDDADDGDADSGDDIDDSDDGDDDSGDDIDDGDDGDDDKVMMTMLMTMMVLTTVIVAPLYCTHLTSSSSIRCRKQNTASLG
jgi:hypothetical protein